MAELLVVTTSLPRTPQDHAGRFVLDWADAMADLGHAIHFVAPMGRHCPYPCTTFREGSVIRAEGAPETLRRTPLRAHLSGVRTALALDRAVRAAGTGGLLVAHWMAPAGVVACRYGSPLIYAHGGDVALLERLPGGRRIAAFLDARAHTIAFVSRPLRARFAHLLGRPPRARLAVAPMGVPPPAPDPRAVQRFTRLAAGRPIVATVGRLVPIKGYDQLPGAMAGMDAVWLAAGDGPERARLRALASRHGAAVEWLGWLTPAERDALLHCASAFVQPSRPEGQRTEGAPVAVMEALAAGLPVVARADGGFREMLPQEALLFSDAESLRARLNEALEAGDADGRHARAGARYRWSAQAADHARLLRSGTGTR